MGRVARYKRAKRGENGNHTHDEFGIGHDGKAARRANKGTRKFKAGENSDAARLQRARQAALFATAAQDADEDPGKKNKKGAAAAAAAADAAASAKARGAKRRNEERVVKGLGARDDELTSATRRVLIMQRRAAQREQEQKQQGGKAKNAKSLKNNIVSSDSTDAKPLMPAAAAVAAKKAALAFAASGSGAAEEASTATGSANVESAPGIGSGAAAKARSRPVRPGIDETEQEAERTALLEKAKATGLQFEAAIRSSAQRPGESFYEYSARLADETRAALASETMNQLVDSHRANKKRDHFKKRELAREEKKERKRQRRLEKEGRDIDDDLQARGLVDHVEFGEVASAPPDMRVVKQKVAKRYKLEQKKQILAAEQEQERLKPSKSRDDSDGETAAVRDTLKRAKRKRDQMGTKEKSLIAEDRDRLVKLYRKSKAQRIDLASIAPVVARSSVKITDDDNWNGEVDW